MAASPIKVADVTVASGKNGAMVISIRPVSVTDKNAQQVMRAILRGMKHTLALLERVERGEEV